MEAGAGGAAVVPQSAARDNCSPAPPLATCQLGYVKAGNRGRNMRLSEGMPNGTGVHGKEGTDAWIAGRSLVERCLEAGMVVNAARLLDGDTRLTRDIQQSGDAQGRAWLLQSQARLAELRLHEALHGPHSALVAGHSMVRWAESAYPAHGLAWPPLR